MNYPNLLREHLNCRAIKMCFAGIITGLFGVLLLELDFQGFLSFVKTLLLSLGAVMAYWLGLWACWFNPQPGTISQVLLLVN